jgi:hypothetical protein
VLDEQMARGAITEAEATARRAEILKGLRPDDALEVQAGDAATDIIRRIPGGLVSSVELGETVIRAESKPGARGLGETPSGATVVPAVIDAADLAVAQHQLPKYADLLLFRVPSSVLPELANRATSSIRSTLRSLHMTIRTKPGGRPATRSDQCS